MRIARPSAVMPLAAAPHSVAGRPQHRVVLATPQTRTPPAAVHQPMPDVAEAAAKASVHVAVDDRVVAAVRHGQPVGGEPHVGQQPPGGHGLVVHLELRV